MNSAISTPDLVDSYWIAVRRATNARKRVKRTGCNVAAREWTDELDRSHRIAAVIVRRESKRLRGGS